MRSKNHHYVPQTLQRRFAPADQPRDNHISIYYSERDDEGKYTKIKRKSIANVFSQPNYHTYLKDDKPDDIIEREFYGSLDQALGEILGSVEKILAKDKIPQFRQNLSTIHQLIYSIMLRTPDFAPKLDDTLMGQDLRNSLLEHAAKGDFSDIEVDEFTKRLLAGDPATLRQAGRQVRLPVITKTPSDVIIAAMSRLNPAWVIPERNSRFILSSRMIYRIGNGGANGFINPNAEIWFPMFPDRALALARFVPRNPIKTFYVNQAKVRKVNEAAVAYSHAVASHSYDLLASLLGQ